MPNDNLAPATRGKRPLPPLAAVVLGLAMAGLGIWTNSPEKGQQGRAVTTEIPGEGDLPVAKARSQQPADNEPLNPEMTSEPQSAELSNKQGKAHSKPSAPLNDKAHDTSFKIENQTIRDLNGKVAYKGTIDLKPTLDRIQRGEANRHHNDGTSFQNREGRLPRKPAGYYKEYVHPTPGINGPGPQRIIIGKDGDIWYTPDHYKTFKQVPSRKS